MTLNDFIEKYTGKFVEYHSFGTGALNQCVDLTNQYFVEVLEVPAVIGTDAVNIPSKVSSDDFEWIENTTLAVPQKGDTIVWSGNWGHIAIFYEGDVNSFVSFDQNWPTGSSCQLVGHSYENVLGWLRPKKDNMTVSACCTECIEIYDYFGVKDFDELKAWKEREEGYLEGERDKVKELEQEIVGLKADLAECEITTPEQETTDPHWNKLYEILERKLG